VEGACATEEVVFAEVTVLLFATLPALETVAPDWVLPLTEGLWAAETLVVLALEVEPEVVVVGFTVEAAVEPLVLVLEVVAAEEPLVLEVGVVLGTLAVAAAPAASVPKTSFMYWLISRAIG